MYCEGSSCYYLHHKSPVLPLLFSLLLSKLTSRCHLDLIRAKLQPSRLCSQRHFTVVPKCRHAQNCQTLLTALDAMRNSFNTRPRRYPYHWCNGILTPPCILWVCTRQLVIHLIYSSWPAEDQTARILTDSQRPLSFRGKLRVMYDSTISTMISTGRILWEINVRTLSNEK